MRCRFQIHNRCCVNRPLLSTFSLLAAAYHLIKTLKGEHSTCVQDVCQLRSPLIRYVSQVRLEELEGEFDNIMRFCLSNT